MAKRGFQGAVLRTMRVREHTATVVGTERIAAHFLRVRMHSDTLFEEAEVVPTAWLRCWFPDPDGKDVEHQRAYTISSGNAATGDFTLDFVLHEPSGPASAWAQRAEPGDPLELTTLGSTKFEVPEELPAGYLIIGDAASIPGISAIIAALPGSVEIELYLEQHAPDDRSIPLPSHPRLRIHWVRREGPESLAAALEARDWSDWYAWVAPESGSLKHLRTRLREDFGFPKSEMYVQAYWVEGRAMGKLRSEPRAEKPETVEADAMAESAVSADPAAGRDQAALPAPDSVPAADPEPVQAAPVDPEPVDPARRPAPGAAQEPADEPAPARGSWRAAAAGRLFGPLRPLFIASGILQGIITLIELAPYFLLVELARLMLERADVSRLWTVGIWALALMSLGVLCSALLMLWLHARDARFERDLRQRLLAKLARLPLGWFDRKGSGEVKQLMQDDTLSLHYLVTHAITDAVAAVVAPIAVLVYLFAVDWQIALAMFIPVLFYVVTMYLMVLRSYDSTKKARKWAEQMNVEAGGYLEGQPVVRVFGGAAASTFYARLGEYIGFLRDWQRPFSGLKTLMDLATRPATFLLIICVFGVLRVTAGGMDPVSLLPFLLLGTTFGAKLLGIGYGISGMQEGMVAARRIQVVLEEDELVPRAPAAAGPRAAGASGSGEGAGAGSGEAVASGATVEFDGVGFAYRPGNPVLQDIDLTLEPGTVTALVGPSGSGKSTLAALLARFYDVGRGAIRIGGDDVRDLDADHLYARVGFVFQDAQLVAGTVRENIALAKPDASESDVVAAARAAQIHDRILRLPEGYDTVLGGGSALSGGERQRLTIARAILADTPVLVLDEATAFADPESEYQVQRALNRLTAGRTVLVIAHRLHTITGVDRIVVLDHGRIVESGTHGELLAAGGRYRTLWEAGGVTDAAIDTDTEEVAR